MRWHPHPRRCTHQPYGENVRVLSATTNATFDGMNRVRISTTVDRDQLTELRDRLGLHDSVLIDRALAALLEAIEAERERSALDAMPYGADPELAWLAPIGTDDIPYDGDIPEEIVRLADARRSAQRGR